MVTSTLRPEDEHSWHSLARACDLAIPYIGNPDAQAIMDAAALWLNEQDVLVAQLLEGIHNPGLSVKNGQRVDPLATWGPDTWAAHTNHLHLAA